MTMITEISESDFRRLHRKGYKCSRNTWTEVDLNKELTDNIEYLISQGYESNLEELKCPFTIAIHKENDAEHFPPKDYYFDKYMDMYTGPATYEIGIGIKHLYSTRDYFEAHEDYWRVRKDETRVVYRIHIEPKWLRMFKLKHKTITKPWPFEVEEKDKEFAGKIELHEKYDLDEENDKWVLSSYTKVIRHDHSASYIPVSEEGKELK